SRPCSPPRRASTTGLRTIPREGAARTQSAPPPGSIGGRSVLGRSSFQCLDLLQRSVPRCQAIGQRIDNLLVQLEGVCVLAQRDQCIGSFQQDGRVFHHPVT